MSVDRSTSQAHCTVLLTRSAVQGQAFALALAEQLAEEPTAEHTVRGPGECRVLFAPLQQARTVPATREHGQLLREIATGAYSWVSFTSANTVRACEQLWGTEFASACQDGGTRIACVGVATARAVRTRFGLEADFRPSVQSAAGMLAEFGGPEPANTLSGALNGTGTPDRSEAPTVLVLEGANARPTLREGLRNLGWQVTVRALYDMVPAEEVAPGELSLSTARALLTTGLITECTPGSNAGIATHAGVSGAYNSEAGRDASAVPRPAVIVATAPSRLHALLGLDTASTESPRAKITPGESLPPVVAIGATTASACRTLNLRYVQADSPSPTDLARATATLLRERTFAPSGP